MYSEKPALQQIVRKQVAEGPGQVHVNLPGIRASGFRTNRSSYITHYIYLG